MDNEKDQDWLGALSGKPNADADPEITRHADALRQAIQRHNAAFHSSEVDTEAGLQKLKFRLRREGLTGGDQRTTLKRFFQFAIAASVLLTVGLVMRAQLHQEPLQNESEIMRGLGNRQVVLAVDPEERLKQLITELDQLGVKHQIERKTGEILLKIQGIDPTKEDIASFLESNHITPPVRDSVELDIRPIPKP